MFVHSTIQDPAWNDTANTLRSLPPAMVSVLSLVPLLVIMGVNTLTSALLTRLFRVRLDTAWGAAAFVALFVPAVTTIVTIIVGAVAGPSLGSRAAVVGLLILVPMAVGITIDVFWMPAPEKVDLPATLEE